MVSPFSAKQNGYFTDVANDLPAAAASGSSLVFKICLIFAIVNVVLIVHEKTEVTKIKKQITIQTGDLFLLFLNFTK
ncbi:hypothetical protein N0U24_03180 [Peribacillus frigoritolerans]|nr:hypothetical protein [Peribacillus frigoritolerans]